MFVFLARVRMALVLGGLTVVATLLLVTLLLPRALVPIAAPWWDVTLAEERHSYDGRRRHMMIVLRGGALGTPTGGGAVFARAANDTSPLPSPPPAATLSIATVAGVASPPPPVMDATIWSRSVFYFQLRDLGATPAIGMAVSVSAAVLSVGTAAAFRPMVAPSLGNVVALGHSVGCKRTVPAAPLLPWLLTLPVDLPSATSVTLLVPVIISTLGLLVSAALARPGPTRVWFAISLVTASNAIAVVSNGLGGAAMGSGPSADGVIANFLPPASAGQVDVLVSLIACGIAVVNCIVVLGFSVASTLRRRRDAGGGRGVAGPWLPRVQDNLALTLFQQAAPAPPRLVAAACVDLVLAGVIPALLGKPCAVARGLAIVVGLAGLGSGLALRSYGSTASRALGIVGCVAQAAVATGGAVTHFAMPTSRNLTFAVVALGDTVSLFLLVIECVANVVAALSASCYKATAPPESATPVPRERDEGKDLALGSDNGRQEDDSSPHDDGDQADDHDYSRPLLTPPRPAAGYSEGGRRFAVGDVDDDDGSGDSIRLSGRGLRVLRPDDVAPLPSTAGGSPTAPAVVNYLHNHTAAGHVPWTERPEYIIQNDRTYQRRTWAQEGGTASSWALAMGELPPRTERHDADGGAATRGGDAGPLRHQAGHILLAVKEQAHSGYLPPAVLAGLQALERATEQARDSPPGGRRRPAVPAIDVAAASPALRIIASEGRRKASPQRAAEHLIARGLHVPASALMAHGVAVTSAPKKAAAAGGGGSSAAVAAGVPAMRSSGSPRLLLGDGGNTASEEGPVSPMAAAAAAGVGDAAGVARAVRFSQADPSPGQKPTVRPRPAAKRAVLPAAASLPWARPVASTPS